jgi:phosphomevalonate kinase
MNQKSAGDIRVSAPGKLVILGEYAVLKGAPALAMAVGQRARVTLRWIEGPRSVLESSLWPGRTIPFHPDALRAFEAVDPETGRALSLVQHLFSWFRKNHGPLLQDRQAIRLELDTGDFYSQSGKLGLGSSAALTVALFAALYRSRDASDLDCAAGEIWPWLWRMYREQPDQRGSGVDIAAACFGHWIRFQKGLANELPFLQAFSREAPCPLLIVWTGHSTSTGGMLERFFQWESREPACFQGMIDTLTRISEAGVAAFRGGETKGLRHAVDDYAEALVQLGEASGLEILSGEHARLLAMARALGISYKPSGAGGGDVGFAMAESWETLAPFRHQVESMGYHIVESNQETQGLEIRPIPE